MSSLENYIAEGEFDPEAPPERIEEGKTYFGHISGVEISDWVDGSDGKIQKNIRLIFRSPGVSGAVWKMYWGIFEQREDPVSKELLTVLSKKDGDSSRLAEGVWYLLRSLSNAGILQKGQETTQIGEIETLAKGAPVQFSVIKNSKGYLDISDLQAWPEGSKLDSGLPF